MTNSVPQRPHLFCAANADVPLENGEILGNGVESDMSEFFSHSTFANGELSVSTSATNSPENSVPSSPNLIPAKILKSKLVILDISSTIAESIRRTHNGESISMLFGEWAAEL